MEQSVKSLFDLYLSCSDLAPSSVAIKRRAGRLFFELFGDMEPGKVTYSHAEGFRNRLAKNGRSRSTANIYFANFAPFFSWLVKSGHIRSNPFSQVKRFIVEEKDRPPYTPDEVSRMMMVSDERWQAMICLGLCSMRRSEILNLVVRDIYFDKEYIVISSKQDSKTTWRWQPKNHITGAIVPCPEVVELPETTIFLHQILMKICDGRAVQPYVFIPPRWYEKNMFKAASGTLTFEERLNPCGNFSRDFTRVLKRASVVPRRFHDLRATIATYMAGHLSLTKTQGIMRHRSPQTTTRYYVRHDRERLAAEGTKIVKNFMLHNVP